MFSSNFSHANLIPFQSTLPRHKRHPLALWGMTVSIHAPHTGSDVRHWDVRSRDLISTHAPHAGSDRNIVYYGLIKSVYIVLDMIY